MKINRANKMLVRDAKQRRVLACGQKLAETNTRMATLLVDVDRLLAEIAADMPQLTWWQKLKRFLGFEETGG